MRSKYLPYGVINHNGCIITLLGIVALGIELAQTTDVQADVAGSDSISQQTNAKPQQVNSQMKEVQVVNNELTPDAKQKEVKSISYQQTQNNQTQSIVSKSKNFRENVNANPKDKVPAIYDEESSWGNSCGKTDDNSIIALPSYTATNQNGPVESNRGDGAAIIDSSSTDIRVNFNVTNNGKDSKPYFGHIFTLPKYSDLYNHIGFNGTNIGMSGPVIIQNMPKGLQVQYSITGGGNNFESVEDIKKESDFDWINVQEIRVQPVDGQSVYMAGKTSFLISAPLKTPKRDVNTVKGLFTIGTYNADFSHAVTKVARFAVPGVVLQVNQPYVALTDNNTYAPKEIQKLMPMVKSSEILVTNSFDPQPKKNVDRIYTGGVVDINLKEAGIADLVKNMGYSVPMGKAKNGIYYPKVNNRSNYKMGLSPYYINLRQVIDAEDMVLHVGNQWDSTDNFVSGMDDAGQPADVTEMNINVNDPDHIIHNGRATKAGKLSVTYSYQIANDLYGTGKPYIISKTAYIEVKKGASDADSNDTTEIASHSGKVPAITVDLNATKPTDLFTEPVHATAKVSATNASGTTISRESTSEGDLLLLDSTSKDVKVIYDIKNTTNKAQNYQGSLLILPEYYKSIENTDDLEKDTVVISDKVTKEDFTKNLPQGMNIGFSTTDTMKIRSYDELTANPSFKWSQVKVIKLWSDQKFTPNEHFTITLPLVMKKMDLYDPAGIFRVGAASGDYKDVNRETFRTAAPAQRSLQFGLPYQAAIYATDKNGNKYPKAVPADIQALMPKSKPSDISTNNLYDEGATNVPSLFTDGELDFDLSNTGVAELVQAKGYSVLLDKGVPRNDFGINSYSDNIPQPKAPYAPYIYVFLRQVIDAKDLSLKIGDKWNQADNFISAIDDNDQPISVDKLKKQINDPDQIIQNGKAVKNGQFTVTYSYKVADSLFGNNKPYIVSKISKVTVGTSIKPQHSYKPNLVNLVDHKEPQIDSDKKQIKQIDNLVSTDPATAQIQLYDNNGKVILNRALKGKTDWYSDQVMNLKDKVYFRVSTNQWVKADNIYRYNNNNNLIIETSDHKQLLVNAMGKTVSNRALAPNTLWKTDRIADINNQTYYRVATNEFVPTTDVIVK